VDQHKQNFRTRRIPLLGLFEKFATETCVKGSRDAYTEKHFGFFNKKGGGQFLKKILATKTDISKVRTCTEKAKSKPNSL
jgi:hypothetical protein